MSSLGEALPEGIAKVSEWIGRQEVQAKELDEVSPGAGDGTRLMTRVVKMKRDDALRAHVSGDVVAMIAAYNDLKPCIELAHNDDELESRHRST